MGKRNLVLMAILIVVLSFGVGTALADDAPVCGDPQQYDIAADFLNPGNLGEVRFINNTDCTFDIGLASYKMFEPVNTNDYSSLESQVLYDSKTHTLGPGEMVFLTVALPECRYQVDAFWGPVIQNLSDDNRYGDDEFGKNRLINYTENGGDFCTPPPPPPNGDPQWCSPGYWRQPHHLGSWAATGISPDEKYSAYFGLPTRSNNGVRQNAPTDPTLWEVLQGPQFYGGEAFNNVGDLLSAAHPDVNFSGERVEDSCPL